MTKPKSSADGSADWTLFGIQIERKIGLTVLTSLLVAVMGGGYKLYAWWRGPDVKLLPPEQVFLYYKNNGGVDYLRGHASMTLINDGEPGYSAIVTREGLRFWFESRANLPCEHYEQRWQKTRANINTLDGGRKVAEGGNDTVAYSVPAGSVESHETTFAPLSVTGSHEAGCEVGKNFLPWPEFVRLAKAEADRGGAMVIEATVDIYREESQVARCRIPLSQAFIDHLNREGWHAPSCIAMN